MCRLRVMILDLLLAENIQNLSFGGKGERKKREQTLCTALKRLLLFSTSPTTGYVLDPKSLQGASMHVLSSLRHLALHPT